MVEWLQTLIGVVAGSGVGTSGHIAYVKKKKGNQMGSEVDAIVEKVFDQLRTSLEANVKGVVEGLVSQKAEATSADVPADSPPKVEPEAAPKPVEPTAAPLAETVQDAEKVVADVSPDLGGVVQLAKDLKLESTGDTVTKIVSAFRSWALNLGLK